MIFFSFLLIIVGLGIVTASVLLLTLHITGMGKWPGFRPQHWDARLKKLATITGGGLLVTLAGMLAGYGI